MIKHNLVSFFVKYLEEVKVQYLRKQKHIQILKCNWRRGYIFQLTLTTVNSAAQACIFRETKHNASGQDKAITDWCAVTAQEPQPIRVKKNHYH